jgi:shikimate kinase
MSLSSTSSSKKNNLFFLVGLMGSGKTHWGQLLAQKNKYQFIDLDAVVESKNNNTILKLFNEFGEDAFRKKEHETLKELFSIEEKTIIATGGGTPCFFDNMNLMNQNGITIWLNDSIENICERLENNKSSRPLIANESSSHLKNTISNMYHHRLNYYNMAKYSLARIEITIEHLQNIINIYA